MPTPAPCSLPRSTAILTTREPPSPETRAAFRYPLLRVVHRDAERTLPSHRRAFGRLQRPGRLRDDRHASSAPSARYLIEQLTPLVAEYGARIEVAVSDQEIPYPYVLERADELAGADVTAAELARHFPTPQLVRRRRRDRRRPVGASRGPGRARWRCSMPRASTIRCGASCTTRAATGATCSTGSCSPTITATSTSSCAGAASSCGSDGAFSRVVLPGNVSIEPRAIRRDGGRRAGRRLRLAPLPDAGLSPGRARGRGRHPRQHRRRPLQRQEHHRPPGRAAPATAG